MKIQLSKELVNERVQAAEAEGVHDMCDYLAAKARLDDFFKNVDPNNERMMRLKEIKIQQLKRKYNQ